MKTVKFLILFTTIFSLVIVSSCKKDDDVDPNNNNDFTAYEIKTVTVPDAMVQSNDEGAQTARTFIGMANSMSGYGGMMTPPSKSTAVTHFKDGGTELYSWEINEGNTHCTITLTFIETTTSYSWAVTISGTLEGLILSNFTYIQAYSEKDETSGHMTLYDPEGSGVLMTQSWQEFANGTFECTLEMPQYLFIKVVTNADGSGSVEVKDWMNGQYVMDFRAEWDASGHGQWWEYLDGVIDEQGSW
jgi:hypothetical protein